MRIVTMHPAGLRKCCFFTSAWKYFTSNDVLKFWKSSQWLPASCSFIYSLLHLTGQLFVFHSVLVCVKWDRPVTSMLRGCFEFLERFLFI